VVSAESAEQAPVRVLWLIKGLGHGGAEFLLVALAEGADPAKVTYEAAHVLTYKSALAPFLRDLGVPVADLGVRNGLDPRWVWRFRRLLKRGRYDIVHVHSPMVAGIARLVALTVRKRPRLMSTEHNSWAMYRWPSRLLNQLTFGLDDAHVMVSNQVLRSVPERQRTNCEVIVYGVKTAQIADISATRDVVRAELGIAPNQVVVCTIANLRREKGYPDLLAAAASVIARNDDVLFLAVGQGPLEAEIRARHHELGLGDRFQLLGYRSDAVRILAASDIFALASLFEGFPIAVMEALAAGLPVVATDAGGVPDVIVDGVEGRVLPRQEPQMLADALLELVENHDLRAQMARAAAAKGQFMDIKPAVERTQALYGEVIARHRRR
jgi:glycosyltransferase involved in cell wall biosynthesis